MIDVLLAWELGSGLGHVNRLQALGDTLAADGLDVVYALVRQPPTEEGRPRVQREEIQAPFIMKSERTQPFPICNYGELLVQFGYHNPAELESLLVGWR